MIEYTVTDGGGGMDMVDKEVIRERIRVRFGTAVADGTDLVDQLMSRVEHFLPGVDDFAALRQEMNDLIFNTLYSRLGPKMTVTARRRPRSYTQKDIDDAADELVGVLIERLRVCDFHYRKIREFFLRTGSMQTLRILKEKYASYLGKGEAEMMDRIEQENGEGHRP